jgi:DNA-binding MarR family transcriptional regulator
MTTSSPVQTAPDLMFLMSWASHALVTEHAVGLAELGISPRAYCVLAKAKMGELTQKQLGDLCGIDKTTMVVTLDELEKAGLAERRLSSTDRRARIVAVTRVGERVVAKAHRIASRIQDDVLAEVSARDRDVFLNVLAGLVKGRLATLVECERPVRRRAPRAS